LVVIVFMVFVPSLRFEVGVAALTDLVRSAGIAVATAAKAPPTMTLRREAPAASGGLAVVILSLALTIALLRKNFRADKRFDRIERATGQVMRRKEPLFLPPGLADRVTRFKDSLFALPSAAARCLVSRLFLFRPGRFDVDVTI
jgi:hypothetical protein